MTFQEKARWVKKCGIENESNLGYLFYDFKEKIQTIYGRDLSIAQRTVNSYSRAVIK